LNAPRVIVVLLFELLVHARGVAFNVAQMTVGLAKLSPA
jgi:hypothetical protein